MNRSIVILLFLIPFFGNAQFNIEVVAIDLENYSSIPDVQFTIGNISSSSSKYSTKLNNIDIELLDDTLFIEHVNYAFNSVPLTYNRYNIYGNTISIHVYGRPWKHEQIYLNLDIAESKKIKNDSVQVQLGSFGDPALITFQTVSQKRRDRKKIRTLLKKVAYDDLQNGEILMTTSLKTTSVPFKKWEWFQTACLYQNEITPISEKEFYLLKSYFQAIEQSKIEKRTIEQEHQRELNVLNSEIVHLQNEIALLKGLQSEFPPSPELEIIPPDEFPFILVSSDAAPRQGFDDFTSELHAAIVNMTTKFSGNITMEIIVGSSGIVRSEVLHSGMDKLEIVEQIQNHINLQVWEPAFQNGRKIESSIILKVNIGPSK